MKIRAATEADLPGIFAIYDREVLHGTATFDTEPKSQTERLVWLRDDANGKYPILVAEIGARARQAAYLVNVTNDAWFANSSAPHQHLAFSRLRAIETGRWFVRAANTGISALIDPDGAVTARTRQFEQAVLKGEVEPRRGQTPYQRCGNVPVWLGSLALVVIAIFLQGRRENPPRH